MKWADKIDMMEVGRASDEAVAHLMSPWARSNLQLRADRDHIHETARLKAEARTIAESRKASQQIGAQRHQRGEGLNPAVVVFPLSAAVA